MSIEIESRSDSRAARRDLDKLNTSVQGIEKSVSKTTSAFSSLATGIGVAITAGLAVKGLTTMTDSFINLNNKLRNVTEGTKEFNQALADVKQIAISTRSNLNGVATLYGKIALSGKRFGISQKGIKNFAQSITKTLAISGATAAESYSAILQLGQGLASNRLAGEELRAVFESAPVFAIQLAEGMDVPFSKLRKLAEQGKLTFATVYNAISKQQSAIDKQFEKISVTYAQAFLNMGTAFSILFKNLKGSLFKGDRTFADTIYDLSLAIFDFAEGIEQRINILRLNFRVFVVDIKQGMKDFADVLRIPLMLVQGIVLAVALATTTVYKLLETSFGGLSSLASSFQNTFTELAPSIMGFIDSVVSNLTMTFQQIVGGLKSGFTAVVDFIKAPLKLLTENLPTIDIMAIFPQIKTAANYVSDLIVDIERSFFWLYDQVIGNSWIPDLVKGVIKWLGMLLGSPLRLVSGFTKAASLMFKGLLVSFAAFNNFRFVAGLGIFLQVLRKSWVLASALGIALKGIVDAVVNTRAALATIGDSSFIDTGFLFVDKLFESYQSMANRAADVLRTLFKKLPDSFQDIFSKIGDLAFGIADSFVDGFTYMKEAVTGLLESIARSPFMRNLKQVFGIQDKMAGSINGEQIDTQGEVGRGPERGSKDRSFGHDGFHAFSEESQQTIRRVLMSGLTIAAIAAFTSEGLRAAMLSTFTVVMGLSIADGFSSNGAISSVTGLANRFVMWIGDRIKNFATEDPFGMLAVIFKLSLAFKVGRALLLKGLVEVLKTPSKVGVVGGQAFEKNVLKNEIKRLTDKSTKHLATARDALKVHQDSYKNQVASLKGTSGLNGKGLTESEIARRLASTSGTNGLTKYQADALRNLKKIEGSIEGAEELRKRTRTEVAARGERTKLLTKQYDYLSGLSKERAEQFKRGVSATAGTVGGVFGMQYGYQIGGEIAAGMGENTPAWRKTAVQLSSGMVGAGLGAALAASISSVVLFMLKHALGTILWNGFIKSIFFRLPIIWAPIFAKALFFNSGWTRVATILGIGIAAAVATFFTNKGAEDTNDKVNAVSRGYIEKHTEALLAFNQKGLVGPKSETDGLLGRIAPVGSTRRNADEALKTEEAGLVRSLLRSYRGLIDSSSAVYSAYTEARQDIEAMAGLTPKQRGELILSIYEFSRSVTELRTGIQAGLDATRFAITPAPSSKTGVELPLRRANGGFVNGPGGPKDDMIPTMLSNGEFVVNAEQSRRNRGLLLALNRGQLPGLATGTAPATGESPLAFGQSIDFLKAGAKDFWVNFKNIFTEMMNNVFGAGSADKLFNKIGGLWERYIKGGAKSFAQKYNAEKDRGKAIELLKEGLKGLGLTASSADLNGSSSAQLNELVKSVTALQGGKRALGTVKDSQSAFSLAEEFQKTFAGTIGALKKIRPIGEGGSNLIPEAPKALKEQFTNITENMPELSLSLKQFYELTDDARGSLVKAASGLSEGIKGLEDATSSEGAAAQFKALEQSRREAGTALADSFLKQGNLLASFNVRLRSFGTDITREAFNRLAGTSKSLIAGFITTMEEQAAILRGSPSPEQRIAAQKLIDSTKAELDKALEDSRVGEEFTGRIKNALKSAFSSALLGDDDETKSTWVSFRDKILFSLSEAVTSTALDSFFDSLFKGLFGQMTSAMGNAAAQAGSALAGLIKSFFAQMFSGGTGVSSLASIGQGVATGGGDGTVNRASGGVVRGIGTGTSDSIHAMVSNGEYVVNARSTKRHFDLIASINSGKLDGYADGGLIGASLSKSAPGNSARGNDVTVNLQVVGDVSRQTKKEIYGMLPTISRGVNSYNAEKGIR